MAATNEIRVGQIAAARVNSQQEGEGQGVVHDMKLSQDVRHVLPYRTKELLGGLQHRSPPRELSEVD